MILLSPDCFDIFRNSVFDIRPVLRVLENKLNGYEIELRVICIPELEVLTIAIRSHQMACLSKLKHSSGCSKALAQCDPKYQPSFEFSFRQLQMDFSSYSHD